MSIVSLDPIAAVVSVFNKRYPRFNAVIEFSSAPGGDEHASSSTRYPTSEEAEAGRPTMIEISNQISLGAVVDVLVEALVIAASDPGHQLEQTEVVISEVKREVEAELRAAA